MRSPSNRDGATTCGDLGLMEVRIDVQDGKVTNSIPKGSRT
jgi:hypothetical protein